MVKILEKPKLIIKFPYDNTKYIVRPITVLPENSMGDVIDVGQYNKCIVFAIRMKKPIAFVIKGWSNF